MGLSSGATPRLTCDRCGRPTWRLVRDADGWACPMCRREGKPPESGRAAPRVIVSDPDTDCATGHCECGACGEPVDPFDAYCRHCGARLEDR